MPGITGQGTTFNLPNFVGDLFGITPEDTPLLSAIGGLTGGKRVTDKRFEWEFYDLRAAADRARVEGANAPTAEERVRSNAYNVVQVIQEAVEVSYTKMAARGQLDAAARTGGSQTNPVTNELDWQVDNALKSIARDVEYAFINGTFQDPADNTTPRKTRGLLAAITTNRTSAYGAAIALALSAAADDILDTATAHGFAINDRVRFTALTGGTGLSTAISYHVIAANFAAQTFQVALTKGGVAVNFSADATAGTVRKLVAATGDVILDAMQMAWDNGGLMESETRTAIVGSRQKRALTKAYVTDKGYIESTRNVGGVDLSVIETDFGKLNIMLDRHMPDDAIALVSLEDLAPVILEIPGKGFLFIEDLAKVGAAERKQIYGEIGLEYGNEMKHAVITDLG